MEIRNSFHTELAKMFLDDIQFRRGRYFYFLGKLDMWNETDDPPLIGESTLENNLRIRNNILYARRIDPHMVSMVCNLHEWKPDLVFEKWDHTKNMANKMFYCLTPAPNFRVYKCLDNAANGPSTEVPYGTSVSPLRLADGYLWKYMYTIPTSKRKKFISSHHMPVQRALDDSFYDVGSINSVSVVSGGSGYVDVQKTFINVVGVTTGTGATAIISQVGPAGEVLELTILQPGQNYFKGAKFRVVGSGQGLNVQFDIDPIIGSIVGYTIINAGYGYSLTNSTTISVGGAVLFPVVSRITGSIENIIIIDPGAGYISPPLLTVTGTVQQPGQGLYEGNLSAIIDAIENNGEIVRVTISDPGKNYPVDTNTSITVSGDGENANFTPVVYNGEVIDVIIENPGSNYSTMILHVVGTGTGAVVRADLRTFDLRSDQNIVEQTAVPGAIYAIEILNQGTNYTENTTLTVIGDGDGCIATPVISNGRITHIIVNNYGKNYTFAEIIIDDISGTGAHMYSIFPPSMGHGFDATNELFAHSIVIGSIMKNQLLDFSITQDYRQFGILKNPSDIFFGRMFRKSETIVIYETEFNHTTNLEKDDILLLNNYRFLVVEIHGLKVKLMPKSSANVTPIGLLRAEKNIINDYECLNILSGPELNKYSGNLLYAVNDRPFMFTEEQSIILKTVISF